MSWKVWEGTGTYEAFAFETVRVKDGKFTEHWDQVTLAAGWLTSADGR